jgi:hypothetical protein
LTRGSVPEIGLVEKVGSHHVSAAAHEVEVVKVERVLGAHGDEVIHETDKIRGLEAGADDYP